MKEIYVTRPSLPAMEDYLAEIQSIWDNRILTNMGEKHNQLENQLQGFLGSPNMTLFANGHCALEHALESLDLFGEVITTAFTFASTTHAIVRKNLQPVFCDVRPEDATLDVDLIESLITERTSAIVPVHVYGHICDVEAIDRLARKYHLKVIYDAAHAFGEKLNGIDIAAWGDLSVFSFHATKVFHTLEGGAVASKNPLVEKQLRLQRNFGIVSETEVERIGGNAKMNEFQAAMGLCNLKTFRTEVGLRRQVIDRYHNNLFGLAGLEFMAVQPEIVSNCGYLPVLFTRRQDSLRDRVYAHLRSQGIYARKYFYPLTCDFACYQHFAFNRELPVARDLAERVLVLPVFSDLDLADVDRICLALREALR